MTSSPKGEAGAQWGDTWFAADLVDALQRAGQRARVVSRAGASADAREKDDVVIVLRGLRRVEPRRRADGSGPLWLLWIISHPDLVEADEPAQYDGVFAASRHWSRAGDFEVSIEPLLQATNAHRFTPSAATPDSGPCVLFAGSTRGEYRPAVRACIDANVDLSLYGVGWADFVAPERIAGEFLPNEQLPAAYASAGVVLNDHWPDMAAQGFLSNRLFDAAATGTRVLSDEATGLDEVFGGAVVTYGSPEDIPGLVSGDLDGTFGTREVRLTHAARIAREHSFDARAEVLVERVAQMRGRR